MTANLPYGPLMNTDTNYYLPFLAEVFVSDAILVVRYLLEEEKPVLAL